MIYKVGDVVIWTEHSGTDYGVFIVDSLNSDCSGCDPPRRIFRTPTTEQVYGYLCNTEKYTNYFKPAGRLTCLLYFGIERAR